MVDRKLVKKYPHQQIRNYYSDNNLLGFYKKGWRPVMFNFRPDSLTSENFMLLDKFVIFYWNILFTDFDVSENTSPIRDNEYESPRRPSTYQLFVCNAIVFKSNGVRAMRIVLLCIYSKSSTATASYCQLWVNVHFMLRGWVEYPLQNSIVNIECIVFRMLLLRMTSEEKVEVGEASILWTCAVYLHPHHVSC